MDPKKPKSIVGVHSDAKTSGVGIGRSLQKSLRGKNILLISRRTLQGGQR